ncbi:hypothetical protein PINS_up021377 [Pythium insidiosum]|nr:hypothetical protein PINS_up021377 [Pythium insidiosum]
MTSSHCSGLVGLSCCPLDWAHDTDSPLDNSRRRLARSSCSSSRSTARSRSMTTSLTLPSFEKFLHDRIKVNGKTGVLGDASRSRATRRSSTSSPSLRSRSVTFKYLTKKYLKKQQLRDYLHVIASDKQTYELRYFNIHDAGNDAEDDEE